MYITSQTYSHIFNFFIFCQLMIKYFKVFQLDLIIQMKYNAMQNLDSMHSSNALK